MCQHNAFFGERATIGRNARIGEHSVFGNDLTVGPDAQIGEGIKCGDNVRIKQGACVGDGSVLRGENVVPANGRAYKDDDTRRTVIEGAKDGYTYRLVGGKCNPDQM